MIFVKIIYFQDLQGVKLILRTELCIKNPHQKSGFECKGYDSKIKCDRVINTAQIFLVLTRFLITERDFTPIRKNKSPHQEDISTYFVTGLTYIYWFSNKSPSLARLLIELLTLPAIIANRNKQVLMSINDKLKPINDIFFMNTLFNQNIGFFYRMRITRNQRMPVKERFIFI